MNKLFSLTALVTVCLVSVSQAQNTPQPTQSMQEQYDKLHGNTPKKTTTQPAKSKTETPQKPISKPAPQKEVAQKPKASSSGESGGFKFSVGVRGGANYSTISDVAGINPKSIIGYHGGLIFNLGTETFSVQPEVLYSQVGFKSETNNLGVSASGTTTFNTITVPLLLKVGFGPENLKVFVNAGGYGSYALNANAKIKIGANTINEKIDFANNEGGRIEYGAVGGLGVSFGLGAAKLLIEGRYFYGLGNNSKSIPGVDKSYFRNIQGSVGLLFPLGGK